MSYTTNSLTNGEEVKFTGTFSKWVLILDYVIIFSFVLPFTYFLGIEAGLVLFLFLAFFTIGTHVKYFTTEFSITNKKILCKVGLISRSTDELAMQKIEGVDVHQTIPGRIFGYGNIVISGTGTQQVGFWKVNNPLEVKKTLQQIIEVA